MKKIKKTTTTATTSAPVKAKKKGHYKGGARTLYRPDLIVEQPVNTMRELLATDPANAWKAYSEMRSIARKRQERAEKNPLLKNTNIIRRVHDLGGFKTVKEIKASKTPERDLIEAYSDVMTYLANESTTVRREKEKRKAYIDKINSSILSQNGTKLFSVKDYDSIGRFFEYVDKQLQKKYGVTKWKRYRDSNQIINAMSEGNDYGLDMKDIYDVYIDWKKKDIKLEQQRARRNVKTPRKKNGLSKDEFKRLAERAGLSLTELN